MSSVDLLNDTLIQMAHELAGWRLWAARKVCDCEALSTLNGRPEMADKDRHRIECRYQVLATDMTDAS